MLAAYSGHCPVFVFLLLNFLAGIVFFIFAYLCSPLHFVFWRTNQTKLHAAAYCSPRPPQSTSLTVCINRFPEQTPEYFSPPAVNQVSNHSFEQLGSCSLSPGNQINGDFTQNCALPWLTGVGTPSLCNAINAPGSNWNGIVNAPSGNIFACLGAANTNLAREGLRPDTC